MKTWPFILLKWMRTIFLAWLFNESQLYFAKCAIKGSHYLRHRQHTIGSMIWKSRDNNLQNVTEIYVHQQENTQIVCSLINSSLILEDKIRWFHNDIEIDFGLRYSKDPMTGSVIIANINYEDGGLWHCYNWDTGFSGNPVYLVVLEEPKAPYLLIDGRRLDPGNLFIPIKENADLSVECVVEGGNPKPKLSWLLQPSAKNSDLSNGIVVLPGLQVFNNSFSMETTANHLSRIEARLPKVLRAHHNSTIICLVNHITLQTPINTSILIDVQYTPSFGISRVPGFGLPIIEGITVLLKCDVDSNPPASPIWQKDNDLPPLEQSQDGYLNFTSIRVDNSGWYKCITRYQLAEYSSIGYFLNVRETQNESADDEVKSAEESLALEVTLGGEVQLECPTGMLSCWGRAKQPGQLLDPLGPGPKLTLGNVVYQEAGEYKCFVEQSSKMGKWRSRSIQVDVKGSPVIYPSEKNITVVINQRVTFSLEYCANPPVIKTFWIREFKSLPPGTTLDGLIAHNVTESNTRHCWKSELTIPSVRETDGGEYMLVVVSERGVAGANILLNVTISKMLSDIMTTEKHNGGTRTKPTLKSILIFMVVFPSLNLCFLYFCV